MIINVGHVATEKFDTTGVSACNNQQSTSVDLSSCIINAASECTVFVRTIIKKSDSYDAMQIDRLKIDTQEKYDALNLQREHHKKFLQTIKANSFDRAMAERPENPTSLSLIYSSIDSIKYNTGNCADMSLILGAIIAKYIPQRLTGIGFSKNNVFDARISTSLMYNSASGGNPFITPLITSAYSKYPHMFTSQHQKASFNIYAEKIIMTEVVPLFNECAMPTPQQFQQILENIANKYIQNTP